MQFTTLALLSLPLLTAAAPASKIFQRSTQLCTDPSGNSQFEWFVTPSQGSDCNTDVPAHRPNSGDGDSGASCEVLYNLQQDPNGATTFTSASVTTPCGGWNVTLYSTDDCSDGGVVVSGTNSAPACVQAPENSPFTHFSAVAA